MTQVFQKSPSGFGGMKSGFLSGKSITKNTDDIIKPKQAPTNPLLIPEVQDKLKTELQSQDFIKSYG